MTVWTTGVKLDGKASGVSQSIGNALSTSTAAIQTATLVEISHAGKRPKKSRSRFAASATCASMIRF